MTGGDPLLYHSFSVTHGRARLLFNCPAISRYVAFDCDLGYSSAGAVITISWMVFFRVSWWSGVPPHFMAVKGPVILAHKNCCPLHKNNDTSEKRKEASLRFDTIIKCRLVCQEHETSCREPLRHQYPVECCHCHNKSETASLTGVVAWLVMTSRHSRRTCCVCVQKDLIGESAFGSSITLLRNQSQLSFVHHESEGTMKPFFYLKPIWLGV